MTQQNINKRVDIKQRVSPIESVKKKTLGPNNKCVSLLICVGLHLCKIQNGYLITSLSFLKNMVMRLKKKMKIFIFLFLFHHLEYLFTYSISLMWWEIKLQTKKYLLDEISTRCNQKKIKRLWEEYVMWTSFTFWPMINISWES